MSIHSNIYATNKDSYIFIKNGAFLCFIECDSNGLSVTVMDWLYLIYASGQFVYVPFDGYNVSVFITTGDYVRRGGGGGGHGVVMFLSLSRLTSNHLPHNYGFMVYWKFHSSHDLSFTNS